MPVKARDPYIFWNFEKINSKMESLAEKFDDVEIVVRDSNGVVNSPYMFKKSETAVDLYFIIGTTIIIR